MIKILTDSTADLPPALHGHPRIDTIPLKVVTPQRTYLDRVDLDTPEFLNLLKNSPTLPTTSQPSAGEFETKYRQMLGDGADAILSIHISSKLSGTVSSAHAALETLRGAPITVFDSLSTSIGLGLLIQQAVKALDAGESLAEVVKVLEVMRDAIKIGFVVDTLEYLHKGGRIGRASALMGTLLNVKPVLTLTGGVIEPLDKARSKRKGIERTLAYIQESIGTERPMVAGIAQLETAEEAEGVRQAVMDRFNCKDCFVAELSPVIGTHTGPGVIGIAGCPLP
ncbi:MAG: DegV family protein [Chloroflexi bacterium]|nr:DegV family protein [Chloroflexota bacterium]